MAPLLLALVLGDRLEENFRLALTMSGGSYAVFADHASLAVLISARVPLAGGAGIRLDTSVTGNPLPTRPSAS